MRATLTAYSFFFWVMIAVFAFPNAQMAKSHAQFTDHNHSEQRHASNYEYNTHDDVQAEEDSHTHEHRHGPEEPLHSHEHSHLPQVNISDAKIAYEPAVYRPNPNSTQVKFSLPDCKLCGQGYLKGIFRPPIT